MPPPKKGSDKREVLSGLPRSRPQRPSARREKARAAADPAAGGKATAAKAKGGAATGAKTGAGAKAAGAAKAGAAKGAAPKAAGAAKTGTRAKANAGAKTRPPRAAATGPKVPRGRHVPPAGYATPSAGETGGPPSGAELISTAVQAAGELVEIGATLGRQALKSALSRLPRP